MRIAGLHAATWLLETSTGKATLWALERLAFLAGALVMLWCFYMVETRFNPVITGWTLDYVKRADADVVLGGTLRKERACELLSTSVMAVPRTPLAPRQLIYQIKPHEIVGGNVPVGFSTWGPWRIEIPKEVFERADAISFFEVVGHHRCHAAWTQETLYGRIPVERVL